MIFIKCNRKLTNLYCIIIYAMHYLHENIIMRIEKWKHSLHNAAFTAIKMISYYNTHITQLLCNIITSLIPRIHTTSLLSVKGRADSDYLFFLRSLYFAKKTKLSLKMFDVRFRGRPVIMVLDL